jgi:hypothetical protein
MAVQEYDAMATSAMTQGSKKARQGKAYTLTVAGQYLPAEAVHAYAQRHPRSSEQCKAPYWCPLRHVSFAERML